MKREFDYGVITLGDIENNENLIFVCNGDSKKVEVGRDE